MTGMYQIVLALLAVNGAAFLAFWRDKRLASAGARRIPERMLLWLAFAGGSLGVVTAQHLFRHKTRKEPFRSQLYAIAALHALALATLVAWLVAPQWLAGLLDRAFSAAVS